MMLSSLFCCFRSDTPKKRTDEQVIDENSRLIPAAEEPLCVLASTLSTDSDLHLPSRRPPSTSLNYGKYEDRLETIVRAKEGYVFIPQDKEESTDLVFRRMVNVNSFGVFHPERRQGDSSSHIDPDFDEPVDRSSLSQAYPEHHIPDIDSFMYDRDREPSRSSSRSYRSTERTQRATSMALSARLVSHESVERLGKPIVRTSLILAPRY